MVFVKSIKDFVYHSVILIKFTESLRSDELPYRCRLYHLPSRYIHNIEYNLKAKVRQPFQLYLVQVKSFLKFNLQSEYFTHLLLHWI